MECISCGGDNAVVALLEIFPCKYCGQDLNIEYNICKDCGAAWKSIDGELISDMTLFDAGIGDLFSKFEEELSEFTPIVNNNNKHIHIGDCIHRCLKCNVICYEVNENIYECPKCGFSWEVIKS